MLTAYFVQHAIALPKDIDENRPISNAGFEETRRVATYLSKHGIKIDHVFHSKKLRSQQTANLFADILQVKSSYAINGMSPNDDPQQLISQIKEEACMFVGHLPNIEKVVSKLVSNTKNAEVLKFQNSAVACVEINAGNARVKWFITPDMC
jgi:phosphohistidine phosphatase